MKKIWVSLIVVFVCCAWVQGQSPVFNHLAIHVVDLQKSKSFYEKIVGLDTIPNPFRDDKHVWFAIGEGAELHIIAGAKTITAHPQDNHLCFRVPSVDTFTKKLSGAGISYVNARGNKNEITIRPDGVKQIYFTDPDGYWIEINDAK
jgi:lactoylglutathione lyase